MPQEDVQSSLTDEQSAEQAEMEENINARDEVKKILAKMPDKGKGDIQRDYAPIQYINITYQGNHIDNSGIITGGIAQQQGGSSHGAASPPSVETIQDFFRPNAQVDSLAALLVLSSLESVQENLFHEILLDLSQRLRCVPEPSENPVSGALAYLQTADELLAPFPIQRETLPLMYGNAKLSLRCLAFCDGQLPGQVRRLAWRMYPQLRPVLIEWLLDFQTQTDSASGRTLAYAAIRGLGIYASLDSEYACHHIIPRLENNCTTQAAVKYLVMFVKQFMQEKSCWVVVDELLHRWCGRSSEFFWQIPYQLYSGEEQMRFCEEIPDILRRHLQQDYDGLRRSNFGWYGKDRGYFLYPAHRNHASAALLAKEIAHCFFDCKTNQDRYQMSVYFLVLFRWDYLTDFSSTPELGFLRGLHDKETRSFLLPVFRFVWRYVELRDTTRQILECHFTEINANGASGAYLERPFEFLAFTGNRIDYENTIKLLKDCARRPDAGPTARHLIDYLSGILHQRQITQIRREG